jgi:diaminopimelate epimerase
LTRRGRGGYTDHFMATLRFVKAHGSGNDFVYVDARSGFPGDPAALAPRLCDRHRGIGADGLILLAPSEVADCRMLIFNSDGSRPEMCGNGIRAFARWAHEHHGLAADGRLRVETDAGVKAVELVRRDGRVVAVTVDMGTPELEGRRIPVDADGEVVERPLEVAGRTWAVTCVSMGNPHCVTFVDAPLASLDLPAIGPRFERHPFFPKRVNTEFVRVASRARLEMRVWERGAGETQACGTGACAVAVAAARTGRAERAVDVVLPGGTLTIDWRADGRVFMTGDAVEVFHGTIEV